MAGTTLARILEDIKTLQPDELRQVQRAVDEQIPPAGYSPEEEQVLREMLRDGLLTEIKPRSMARPLERPLVPIQGKPLSETILEERR
jgi:hypothetical protein